MAFAAKPPRPRADDTSIAEAGDHSLESGAARRYNAVRDVMCVAVKQKGGMDSMGAYPKITGTQFGSIGLDDETYDRDIYILIDGQVKKRKKKPAREAYGNAHKIGPDELARLCKGRPKIVFIGTGQQGVAELTEEDRRYLEKHGIDYAALPTPQIVASYNACEKPKAALIHVTC